MATRMTKTTLTGGSGLEVDSSSSVPNCSHGKALLFTRTDNKTGESREFYACSVSRDRKVCALFHWKEDWERKAKKTPPGGSRIPLKIDSRKKPRASEGCEFETLVDNKTNAQFVFDATTVGIVRDLIGNHVSKLEDPRVLCVGTPSIHKALLDANISSVLIDEDARLADLFPHTYRFNAFNGSWFANKIRPVDDNFSVIVCDPPFHPELLPAMASTLQTEFPVSLSQSLLLMAFPYFASEKVSEAFASLVMTDIRLTYRNHPKYKTHIRSPVRLFSSMRIREVLSGNAVVSGHCLCRKCDDFVSLENHHCDTCNSCTTIAGQHHYKHCTDCDKCVKSSASHCMKCKRCFVGSHSC
jgi:hypothetical protein